MAPRKLRKGEFEWIDIKTGKITIRRKLVRKEKSKLIMAPRNPDKNEFIDTDLKTGKRRIRRKILRGEKSKFWR
ncbi:MAG: hypothetical protein HYT72_02935 [Candidatus Aenigmarchaeota archaeon]|nr:hypothetical protein [Candidatus Aenigmarchaeota archaeon]